jgi:2,3-bisphosphoglycerate-dependent phosphoglycerate mutase
MSDQEIEKFEIPTGVPLVYQLDSDLKALRHFYLKDENQDKDG